MIGPVFRGIGSLDDNAFLVPVELRADSGGAVPERQAAAPAVRGIEPRSVQQQVAVERDLSRLEFDIHLGAVHSNIFHGLVEHVVVGIFAHAVGQVSVMMGFGHETHAGVARVRVVDRQPGGNGL